MSYRGGMSSGIKRKRPGADPKRLTDEEKPVFELIHSKGDVGIWKGSIKSGANIPNAKAVDNFVKSLLSKGLIKEVPDVQSKGKKRLMATEFEPSTELTGGVWYQDGMFDGDMIDNLRKACIAQINKAKVLTADGVLHLLKRSGALNMDLKIEHVKQLLDTLCLENEIFKVKSNGLGEFVSFPINSDCCKIRPKRKKTGAMASFPCGACPRINQCVPDGIISPKTCEYFSKWLDF